MPREPGLVELRHILLNPRIRPTFREGGELRRINEAGDLLRRSEGEGTCWSKGGRVEHEAKAAFPVDAQNPMASLGEPMMNAEGRMWNDEPSEANRSGDSLTQAAQRATNAEGSDAFETTGTVARSPKKQGAFESI